MISKINIGDSLKKYACELSRNIFFITSLFLFSCLHLAAYEVRFEGVSDPIALTLIRSVSQLEKLKETPPPTITGLKRRTDDDLSNIVQALHSLAYYNSRVEYAIENEGSLVVVKVNLGPIYPLVDFQIHTKQHGVEWSEQCEHFLSLDDLKVTLGEPALPETILNAEDLLLEQLNLMGYAFALIEKREVLVNQSEKTVTVILNVDVGPITYFGPIQISGLERVKESFFYKNLFWRCRELYDPRKIEKTREALELSGLFRSVNITQAEEPPKDHLLPLDITVIEAKQRSMGLGLNYATDLGPGVTAEWEDRNILGEGQKLSFRSDIWQKLQTVSLTYLIPNFGHRHQNLIWLLDYNHEKIRAFTESTFALSATIERQLTERLRFSYGVMYKLINSERSDLNGTFDLIKFPLHVKWSNADHLLDPTKGFTFNLKIVPSFQVLGHSFGYSINTFTTSFYQSLRADNRHIFAAKLMLGSIIGASKHEIPPPERFLAGSENALRGYSYLTVSPLGRDHKPIGGRSLLIYSLESRHRIGKDFGGVFFYEIGNVFRNSFPRLNGPFLQSIGIGLRYYTPLGPIGLDIAVPLNRRRHIDGPFQVYFSIGQNF